MALTLETVTSSLREHVSLSFLSPSQHDSWRSGALCPGSEILLISLLRPQENRQLMEPARAGKVPGENVQRNKKIQFGVFHPEKMHFHTSVLHFRHYPQERWGNRVAALQKPSDHNRKGKFMRKSSSQGSETSAAT